MGVWNRTSKEVMRHLLRFTGADFLLDGLRKHRGISTDYLQGGLSDRFGKIYATGSWSKAGRQAGELDGPSSGLGSSLQATANIRAELPHLLQHLGTERLVDIGCGDFTWMRTLDLPVPYCGVDIVGSVIAANQARYALPDRSFMCLDASKDDLPAGDTVLCREIIFHLSFADIRRMLENIAKKPRRFLLATTDTATLFNADIRSGDFRILNLRRRPFGFPAPAAFIQDAAIVEGRVLAAWPFEAVNEMLDRTRQEGMPSST